MTQQDQFKGHAPSIVVGEGNPEALKYGKLWEREEYRAVAPGEIFASLFMKQLNPKHGSTVIDFGAGTGRGAARLRDAGMKVTMLDFVRNSLDPAVAVRSQADPDFRFLKHDLTKPSPVMAEYGYCTDVMEHIPTKWVPIVLENILRAAKIVFFSISLEEDRCGKMIGEPLHLSVMPFEWWTKTFKDMGCRIDWKGRVGSNGFWIVSAWEDAQVVVDHGEINVSTEQIRDNIRANLTKATREGISFLAPAITQNIEVAILGGGPSLDRHIDEIRTLQDTGTKIVTLNGSYNWAVEHGIRPSATVIVDAREFNSRFVRPVVEKCKYLMASQVHPSVLEGLPSERVYLWHVMNEATADLINEFCPIHYAIPGGSTVLLRAIPLLRTLGFHRFHLFGCDSCLIDGDHHGFAQPENDGQKVLPIMVTGGKIFWCHPWMVSQAQEFITLVCNLGDEFDMVVHGEGLLAHIINTGATIAPGEEG